MKPNIISSLLLAILASVAMAAAQTPGAATSAAPEPAADDAPLRRYLQAYESMNMAAWLKQQELPEEAADIFGEALDLYQQLARNHPDWQSDLVQFRIAHCEKELAALRGATPAPKPEPIVAPASGTPSMAPAPAAPESAPITLPSRAPTLDSVRNTARLRRAVQLEKVTDWPAALAVYREILDDVPAYLPALQGAARIYFRMNMMDEARAMLETAAQLPQNDEATLLLRAMLLCHDGDFAQARPLLEAILKRNPWSAYAHLYTGVALAATGQLAAAEEATLRAISMNSKLGDAYYNLTQLSLRHQPVNLDVTRNHYRNALKYGARPDPTLEALVE